MIEAFLAREFNVIGVIGVIIVLVAYFFLQLGKMKQEWVSFSLMNFVGSIFILISLCYTWNLASGIIEIAWLVISFLGLVKSTYQRYFMRGNA